MPEGECGPCPVFEFYPGIRLTTEEKSRKNLSQGSQKVPNRTVIGAIRLVDLAAVLQAASTGLLTFTTLKLCFRVNPRSAQVSAELPNLGVPRIS